MPLSEDDVREILRLIDESNVEELRIETDELSLHVVRGAACRARAGRGTRGRGRAADQRPRRDPRADARHLLPRRGSGGGAVRGRGRAGRADTVVCLIEVMKMMNSVPAGVSGHDRRGLRRERGARRVRDAALPGATATRDRHRRHDDARRQPEPLERDRPDDAGRPRDRADDRPGRAITPPTSPRARTWRSRCASTARTRGSGSGSSAPRCRTRR